jgi:drug/metabolite transporter (DMT)-like permease
MKKGFLYIALAALLFSTMEIALKGVSGAFKPLQLTFLRFALGGLVLLPLARKSLAARPRLGLSDWGFFALAGLICVAIAMTLYQVAVSRAPASVVAVVFSCNPLFIIPLAAVFLGEKVTGRKLLSLGLSVLGIGVIAWPAFTGSRDLDALGIVLTVASAILFAVYGIMGRARGQRYGSVAMTCLSFLCGSAELLALIGISHIAPVSAALGAAGLGSFASVPLFSGLGLATLPAFLYIAIGITGGGYVFWFLGMEHTSAQTGSLVFFIKPALAPLLAWLILGEAIGPTMAMGMALVLSGAALGLPKRAEKPA